MKPKLPLDRFRGGKICLVAVAAKFFRSVNWLGRASWNIGDMHVQDKKAYILGFKLLCLVKVLPKIITTALSVCTVPFSIVRHITLKASVMGVHAKGNACCADWLMSVFVNELAPPHVCNQQGQCMQQCQAIMKGTIFIKAINDTMKKYHGV